jgi:hypothetical protein
MQPVGGLDKIARRDNHQEGAGQFGIHRRCSKPGAVGFYIANIDTTSNYLSFV